MKNKEHNLIFVIGILIAAGVAAYRGAEFNLFTSKESSFLLMYISSTVSVILSVYSYFKYIQYER